jgi:hypothetical protein
MLWAPKGFDQDLNGLRRKRKLSIGETLLSPQEVVFYADAVIQGIYEQAKSYGNPPKSRR